MSDLNHRFPRQASRRWGAQASDEKRRSAEYAPGQADRCSVAKSGTGVPWLALSAEEEDIKGSPARETCFFYRGQTAKFRFTGVQAMPPTTKDSDTAGASQENARSGSAVPPGDSTAQPQ